LILDIEEMRIKMKQSNYVIVLVVLAVLNIYLGLAFLSGSSVINFLVG
jgi:hypothetical protein